MGVLFQLRPVFFCNQKILANLDFLSLLSSAERIFFLKPSIPKTLCRVSNSAGFFVPKTWGYIAF